MRAVCVEDLPGQITYYVVCNLRSLPLHDQTDELG